MQHFALPASLALFPAEGWNIVSVQLDQSILWAIVHGICSWFYVIFSGDKR